MRPAHCLSDHAPRPTPFSLTPAFGCDTGCPTTLGLGTASFCGCWLGVRPRPLPSRARPSRFRSRPLLQAPPHPRTPGTRPHHSIGKLPGGGQEDSGTPNSTGLGARPLCSLVVRPQMSSCSHRPGTLGAHPSCRCPCPSPVPAPPGSRTLGCGGCRTPGPLPGGQRRGARGL